jgi:hypothetical protein
MLFIKVFSTSYIGTTDLWMATTRTAECQTEKGPLTRMIAGWLILAFPVQVWRKYWTHLCESVESSPAF